MGSYNKKFSDYRTGNDNYHYLEDRNCEFLNGYRIGAGLDFFVPSVDIFPNPKDYFAIREENILESDIRNLIHNPLKCTEDFFRVQRVENIDNDICSDIFNTIIGNYQICLNSEVTQSEILAFRCIFRFINEVDTNGMVIRPDDKIINGLIDHIFNVYSKHIIVASTNKFTNTVHFLISNLIADKESIDNFIEYYRIHRRTPNTKNTGSLLFTRNIGDRFQSLQNNTERFLYFTPKV